MNRRQLFRYRLQKVVFRKIRGHLFRYLGIRKCFFIVIKQIRSLVSSISFKHGILGELASLVSSNSSDWST